jgi:predicted metal-dependent hydrolase
MPGVSTQAPPRSIPTRRLALEESLSDVPRHFAADGDLILSHLAAALSAVFPDGEDFFVRSVRAFRDRIDDPELARQVSGFIGQEAMHGREHRAFNDRLDALGYPTKRVERLTRRALTLRERAVPPEANLALTAALEHFTATLAELLLRDEEVQSQFGHDEVRNLFLWHALEESEHKAVAFDVYRAVGGTERMRVWTMRGLRIGFVAFMAVQIAVSLALDPATYRRGNLRRSWRRFRRSPLMSRELWHRLKDYDRPDFHPDHRDTTELVTHWREKLFGDRGTLKDKLARRTAA